MPFQRDKIFMHSNRCHSRRIECSCTGADARVDKYIIHKSNVKFPANFLSVGYYSHIADNVPKDGYILAKQQMSQEKGILLTHKCKFLYKEIHY